MKPIILDETPAKSVKKQKRRLTKQKRSILSGPVVDFFVPPIDESAVSVDKIYPLDKILTPEQYETIYNEMTQKEYQLEYTKRVSAIYESTTFTKEQTVLAMYLCGLQKFLLKYKYTHVKPDKKMLCYSSETLNKHIQQNFSVDRQRRGNYRIMCYALVLNMLINKYRVNLQEFVEEFKIGPHLVLRICQATGGTVQEVNGKRMLVLKLPLMPRRIKKVSHYYVDEAEG